MAKPTPEKVAEFKTRAVAAIQDANPEYLIGLDEVGFGAISGPLVIGAVGVPVDWVPPVGLTDSKELSRKQVSKLATEFFDFVRLNPSAGVHWSLFWSYSEEIDRNGLGRCRRGSLHSGIETIRERYPSDSRVLAIVDGNLSIPNSVSVPKADLVVPVVSMAAVIAKYSRDEWMIKASKQYGGYGFEFHVGYDVPSHRLAIQKLGPCPLHRISTRTLKDLMGIR